MTQQEAVSRWMDGELLAIGEYRMSRAEMLNWRDKTNGQARSAPMLSHTIECGNISLTVAERIPDNVKLDDLKIPWSKGQKVVVHFNQLTTEKGLVSARGSLDPLALTGHNGQPEPERTKATRSVG